MARRKRRKKSNPIVTIIIIALAALIAVFSKYGYDFSQDKDVDVPVSSDDVKVHIIDVGQGSSSLIQCGKEGILIDCGEAEYADTVINYVKKVGVTDLKYVIASHPHSDHIGGMAKVLNALKPENIVVPQIDDKNLPTTACYTNMLKAIDKNSINGIYAKYGNSITISNVSVKFLAPTVQMDDLNNMSVVCYVKAINNSFIFLADAEKSEMKTITNKGANVKCDVMVMGHHGSSTSLDKTFLNNASFSTAVISCGKDNKYGHPHKEVTEYLKTNNKKTYRTDKQGNIVFTCVSDSSKFTVSTEK